MKDRKSNMENGAGSNPENGLPPMAETGIRAGFPSPADDYMNPCIDLNKELVRHPSATFYGRVAGDSMADAGIEEGDILVIDKSLEASDGSLAVCFLDGEFTLKRIALSNPETGERRKDVLWLVPANKKYRPIEVGPGSSFIVWGIVTYIIKKTY